MKPTDHKISESGFAMPIAIGFGAIMIILGTTMIIRSNQSQVTSLSQRSSHQSLASAESGISQFLSLLNRYRVFASTDPNNWNDLRNEIRSLPGCSTFANPGSDPEADMIDSIIDDVVNSRDIEILVNGADASDGTYQVAQYNIPAANGILNITGIASDNRNTTSVTDLEVEFPVDNSDIPPTEANNSIATGCSNLAQSIAARTPKLPINDFSELESQMTALAPRTVLPSALQGVSLPLGTDPDGTTYIVNGDLTTGTDITVRSGQTVFLVTEDDINIQDDQAIKVEDDTASLFLISYGDVTLRGNSVEPIPVDPATPSGSSMESLNRIPFHVYMAAEGTLEIEVPNVSGNVVDIPIVAYAPFGTVNLIRGNLPSPNIFKGAVWAKEFNTLPSGTPPSDIFTPHPSIPSPLRTASNLSVPFWRERLDIGLLRQYNIRPISAWKRNRTP